jgi:hypothetical protein
MSLTTIAIPFVHNTPRLLISYSTMGDVLTSGLMLTSNGRIRMWRANAFAFHMIA